MTTTTAPEAASTRAGAPQPRTGVLREVLTVGPILVAAAVALELAARAQAGHLPLLRACVAVLVTQVLPGVVLWRAVRGHTGWLVEDLTLGTAVGAALGVVGQIAAIATGVGVLAQAVPLAVGAVVLAVPSGRRRVRRAAWQPLPWWWGTLVALVTVRGLQVALYALSQPMEHGRGWTAQYVDLSYHLALAGEVAHRFPPHSPQVADQTLNYHWFAHAWMAQVGATSGTELDVVLLRFMPVFIGVLVPVAIAVVGLRVGRYAFAGPVAAAAAMLLGMVPFWVSMGARPISAYSPTLGFSALILCAAAGLIAVRWRGEGGGGRLVTLSGAVLGGVLMVVSFGSKGSSGPVLVVGTLVAVLVAYLGRHPARRMVLLDTGVALLALGFVLKVLFAGNDGAMSITPFTSMATERQAGVLGAAAHPGSGGLAVLALLLGIALALPYLGAFGVLADRIWVRDPLGWLCVGAGAAGMGAVIVLQHQTDSQVYFLDSALPLLGVGVATGLGAVAGRVRSRGRGRVWAVLAVAVVAGALLSRVPRLHPVFEHRLLVSAVLEVVLFVGLALMIGLLGWALGNRRGTAFLLAVLVSVTVAGASSGVKLAVRGPYRAPLMIAGANLPDSVNGDEVTAARWIRDHSGVYDVVMTNRHCRLRFAPRCDDRRFYLAAYSERRVLVEGWGYTRVINYGGHGDPNYNSVFAPFFDQPLLRLNDGFYRHPDAASARSLWARGVRWVYVDRLLPHVSLARFGTLVLRNHMVDVYRLDPPHA